MIKLSVVIPNWNGADLLKDCLKSLKQQSFKEFELIIVDNGSTDKSVEIIKKDFETAKIVALSKNMGFAPAVNIGINYCNTDYIVLLNNDTKLDPECLKVLYTTAKRKKDYSMFAAKMLNFYDKDKIDSAGTYITSVGHANGIGWQEKDSAKFKEGREVFMVSGGGALFKKDLFDKVGVFDEDYFAYFEDVDLCLRAQLKGFKAWYEPKAIIYHVHKATSSRNKSFTEYLQFRNMTITILKDFPTSFLIRNLNWLKVLLVNIHTVWFLSTKGFFWQALKAELYIIVHIFSILKQRRRIQKGSKAFSKRFDQWIEDKRLHVLGVSF